MSSMQPAPPSQLIVVFIRRLGPATLDVVATSAAKNSVIPNSMIVMIDFVSFMRSSFCYFCSLDSIYITHFCKKVQKYNDPH